MPKIVLKHKSPEFADAEEKVSVQICEMPGCQENAEHRAPKHRGLNEYYMFCFDHIKEYNKAWDFFEGMSEREVQDHMLKSMYGDRPTWKYSDIEAEQKLHEAARSTYFYGEDTQHQSEYTNNNHNAQGFHADSSSPEYEAMAIMGLSPPLNLEDIKSQYKKLAKKYHPDLNKNNSDAEELLKKINMAYTILKLAYEEYSNIQKRNA